ncbi:Uncharacterised protein [Vibrio cholerae]|nr:Uncharacterised protein [Vibrio cholerae]CSC22760.1 Uncharacterised protein [Vibrio cholerae]
MLVAFQQRVKGVEELFLRTLFVGKELNIVDQQGIYTAIVAFEFFNRVVLQGFYHVLHETLRVHVHHFSVRVVINNRVTHRMQQVRFTQTSAAIQKEGVIRRTWVIRDLASRGQT